MIECSLAQGCKVNGNALERRTTLAVSAWPAPLSPLGFSASDPITGAESLACLRPPMPSLRGVDHVMPGFFFVILDLSGLIH